MMGTQGYSLEQAVGLPDLDERPDDILDSFVALGLIRLRLSDRQALAAARDATLGYLRGDWAPELERLEDYHRFVVDDARHDEIQYAASEMYWASGIHHQIICGNFPLFARFFGPDLECQKYPYLRIARPEKAQDNVGFHRDSHYGTSPFELSCFIPLMDLDEGSALRFIPGSHTHSESTYAWVQEPSPTVVRGSRKHKLGFPYAPKRLDPGIEARTRPVPLSFGDALLFNTAMVHGQRINASRHTRFSTDIRLVNAFAPINRERSVHADYYRAVSLSAVTRQARLYEEANPQA